MSSVTQDTTYSSEQFNMDDNVNTDCQIGKIETKVKIPVPAGLRELLRATHAISDYKEVYYTRDCSVFQEYKRTSQISPDANMIHTDEQLRMRRKFLELKIHRILRPIASFMELRVKNWVGFIETCTDAHDLLLTYADELTPEMLEIEQGYRLLFSQHIELASMENQLYR